MSSRILLLLLPVLLFLSGCQDKNIEEKTIDPIIKEERISFPVTKDSIRTFLQSSPQVFTFAAIKDTQLITSSGLSISVPAGIFLDENDQPATNVSLEVIEALSVNDFIKNGLTTTSGDEILESGGMFYINAVSNGKPLRIKEDQSLMVQVPSANTIGNMQVFYGNYDAHGTLNWSPSGKSTSNLDNSMIALPRKLINLSGISKQGFFAGKSFIKKELEALDNSKYEDTYIMTNEFKQRLSIYLLGAVYDRDSLALSKLIKIYTSNIEKDLKEADKLAIDYLSPRSKLLFAALKDSVKTDSLAMLKDTTDWAKSMKFAVSAMVYHIGKYTWGIAQKFPEAGCTKPINFKKLNIDSTTTRDVLLGRGYNPEEADKLLFWFREQKSQIAFLKKAAIQKEASMKTAAAQKEAFNYTMSVKKFGWVNIDRFLNDENCQESNFTIRLQNKDSIADPQISLIFPVRKICISNIYEEKGEYSFTKKGTMYRKLPIGDEAYLIAMGTKGKVHYFGFKKIKIPKSGTIEMSLTASTLEEIKSAVENNIK